MKPVQLDKIRRVLVIKWSALGVGPSFAALTESWVYGLPA